MCHGINKLRIILGIVWADTGKTWNQYKGCTIKNKKLNCPRYRSKPRHIGQPGLY